MTETQLNVLYFVFGMLYCVAFAISVVKQTEQSKMKEFPAAQMFMLIIFLTVFAMSVGTKNIITKQKARIDQLEMRGEIPEYEAVEETLYRIKK